MYHIIEYSGNNNVLRDWKFDKITSARKYAMKLINKHPNMDIIIRDGNKICESISKGHKFYISSDERYSLASRSQRIVESDGTLGPRYPF